MEAEWLLLLDRWRVDDDEPVLCVVDEDDATVSMDAFNASRKLILLSKSTCFFKRVTISI